MDPSILTKKLVDIGQEKMGSDWKSAPYPLQKLTLKDIDNTPLEFDPGRPLQPYKRVLNFQARQARKHAIRRGWQSAPWDFEDYLTEGMDLSEKLKIWYKFTHYGLYTYGVKSFNIDTNFTLSCVLGLSCVSLSGHMCTETLTSLLSIQTGTLHPSRPKLYIRCPASE